MRQEILLREPVSAHQALAKLWLWAKSMLLAGHRLVVEVRTETRSDKQNRMLHGMCGRVAKTKDWAGAKRDTETWKRLFMAAWLRARGEHVEILPAIDGHGVDIVFRRTSKLTRAECVELCDFIAAWAAENGVDLSWADPETGEIFR